MEKIEFLILKNLLHNEDYMRKVIPFLKSEYFQDKNQKIVTPNPQLDNDSSQNGDGTGRQVPYHSGYNTKSSRFDGFRPDGFCFDNNVRFYRKVQRWNKPIDTETTKK